MFNFEVGKKDPVVSVKSGTIMEASSNLNNVIIESDVEIAECIMGYQKLMSDNFGSNGAIYDSKAQGIVKTSTLDILTKTIEGLVDARDKLLDLKKSITDGIMELANVNKNLVSKYQPLLKKINTSKYSYKIPKYNFDVLCSCESMQRAMDYIKTIPSLNRDAFFADNGFKAVGKDFKNPNILMNEIKRQVLGASKTMNMEGNFFNIMSDIISDPALQEVKSFSDSVFDNMLISADDMTHKLAHVEFPLCVISEMLSGLNEMKASIISAAYARDEFYDSMKAKAYASKKLLVCGAISLIGDIMTEKYRLLVEMLTNYSKIVLDCVSKCDEGKVLPDTILETYIPETDSNMEHIYMECNFCGLF